MFLERPMTGWDGGKGDLIPCLQVLVGLSVWLVGCPVQNLHSDGTTNPSLHKFILTRNLSLLNPFRKPDHVLMASGWQTSVIRSFGIYYFLIISACLSYSNDTDKYLTSTAGSHALLCSLAQPFAVHLEAGSILFCCVQVMSERGPK